MRLDLVEIKQIVMHPWMLKGCCVCLSVLIYYEIFGDFSTVSQIRHVSAIPIVRQSSLNAPNHVLPLNLRGNLFGVYTQSLHNASMKPSLLKITLVGLVYSTDSQVSEVIVHTSDGQEKSYHVGDELYDGVKIERITKDGMVINRDGNLESVLYFTYKHK